MKNRFIAFTNEEVLYLLTCLSCFRLHFVEETQEARDLYLELLKERDMKFVLFGEGMENWMTYLKLVI